MIKRFVLLLALLIFVPALYAGATTGGVRGTVRDLSGAPLAGAELVLKGQRVPDRTATTDARGEYRFLRLPPGDDYEIIVSFSGFQALRRHVTVPLGVEVTVEDFLQPAIIDEVTVIASSRLIDVTNPTTGINITAAELNTLPARRDFQQLLALAPGVMFGPRDAHNPTVSGATHLENDYIIEGLSTRDPRFGESATNLPPSFIEEVQVITAAAGTAFGRAHGGVVNVLTRSGTNVLTGELIGRFESADWASTAVERENRGTQFFYKGNDRSDLSLAAGGPLLRDRAWLFAAVDPRRDTEVRHHVDHSLGIDREQKIRHNEDVYAGKLTLAPAGAHLLTLTAFGSPRETKGWTGAIRSTPEAGLRESWGGGTNLVARYDLLSSADSWIEVLAGRHRQDLGSGALLEQGRIAPYQYDLVANFAYGGNSRMTQEASRRLLSTRGYRALGRHELTAGAEVERNRFEHQSAGTSYYYWGTQLINDQIGEQEVLWFDQYDQRGHGTNNAAAAYFEDRFRLSDNVVVTAGLRWENQRVTSGRGVTIVDGITADGGMLGHAADEYSFGNNWAPRLALVWDPSGRGRSKVYASAGRYFQAMPTQTIVTFLNGTQIATEHYYRFGSTRSDWYNPTGSPLTSDWILFDRIALVDPPRPAGIVPGTRMQSQLEASIGGEVLVGSNATVGIRYVNRRLDRVIDDRGVWRTDDPRQLGPEYFLFNVGEGTYGADFERPTRDYQALHLTLQKRMSNRWQLGASALTARERGDYDGLYEYSSYSRNANAGFAFDVPGLQRNAYGRLRGDIPYQFKLYSSIELPFGFTVAENFSYSAGVPISAISAPVFTGWKRAYHLTPRGSMGRTPDIWALDLRTEWRPPVRVLQGRGLSFFVDVFNVTNNHAVREVDELYIVPGMPGIGRWTAPENRDEWGYPRYDASLPHSPWYGTPILYQLPRTMQAGLKLRY
jgi:hypothetical protein